ncbi:uncharacterized protein LOC114358679 [Ostrinia furnacalis]|uniref:uncharacterized protein LOC114358679 n=1 Tax=Ostrinia furnacalis TaxID=93504 RepID=UPI0010402B45|nr:uncharacterized protein LOC114358679 [Ostrinia furnacalis]
MSSEWRRHVPNVVLVSFLYLTVVDARGLLLLYRPKDISSDCVFSHHLRYDLSFGNGMSDTITLVFRTLNEMDYECLIEIVTEKESLLVVIRFPNPIGDNCVMNGDAFTVLKKNKCLRICDLVGERDTNSPYFIISVKERIRFRFLSNSSINSDMNANLYQVTATSARKKPRKGCDLKNESTCVISEDEYCFTSGVVCDGIKNCGVTDWFDERKTDCELPVERIGYAPVVAVLAVLLCATLAAGHLMMRWLPPLANSFFIFNSNEDNRLIIEPVFTAPDFAPYEVQRAKRASIIPVPSSSSEDTSDVNEIAESVEMNILEKIEAIPEDFPKDRSLSEPEEKPFHGRKNTIRVMTELIQQRLRSVAGRRWSKTSKRPSTTPDVL